MNEKEQNLLNSILQVVSGKEEQIDEVFETKYYVEDVRKLKKLFEDLSKLNKQIEENLKEIKYMVGHTNFTASIDAKTSMNKAMLSLLHHNRKIDKDSSELKNKSQNFKKFLLNFNEKILVDIARKKQQGDERYV